MEMISEKQIYEVPHGEVAGLPGFTHGYADDNETRVHYVAGGQGPAIVLIHGWPFTWAVWRKIMPLLAEAGYTVIAPDQRGIGDSAKPDHGYEKTNSAKDIRELVSQMGLDQIHLVGTDIGAMTAYAFAVSYPECVQRLVLSESVLPGFGLEELMDVAKGGSWHFGFHMQVDLADRLTRGKEAEYLESFWRHMSPLHPLEQTLKDELLSKYQLSGAMRASFMHYESLLRDGEINRQRTTQKLNMPLLVLNGSHGLPQAPLLQAAHERATLVQQAILQNARHTLAEDNPQELALILKDFFV